MADSPGGLLPDFRSGGGVMRIGVIRIIELIQQFPFATLRHFRRQIARAFHPLLFGDQNQLGTVGQHRGPALLAHVVRHQELHLIAFQRGNHRQRDTGIPAGGFNQDVARLYFTAFFGFNDH